MSVLWAINNRGSPSIVYMFGGSFEFASSIAKVWTRKSTQCCWYYYPGRRSSFYLPNPRIGYGQWPMVKWKTFIGKLVADVCESGSDTGKGGKLIYIFGIILEYSGNDLLMVVGGCLYLFWENAIPIHISLLCE